ncbi:MAG: hypothetical protein A2Z88_10390 [Omnitrophica WOR_2 bacterium GWA2_47_8]|nr:MAG: hypothetical protein A2Z88_10390 [Omnitrophica WOR_2 bacterium GWA2_47_8]
MIFWIGIILAILTALLTRVPIRKLLQKFFPLTDLQCEWIIIVLFFLGIMVSIIKHIGEDRKNITVFAGECRELIPFQTVYMSPDYNCHTDKKNKELDIDSRERICRELQFKVKNPPGKASWSIVLLDKDERSSDLNCLISSESTECNTELQNGVIIKGKPMVMVIPANNPRNTGAAFWVKCK